MAKSHDEKQWQTRKKRIDPKLDAAGWRWPPKGTSPLHLGHRSEEEPTANGPADYALWLDSRIVGVIAAKKPTVGPQNVLVQADRYARGLEKSAFDFDGFRAPFLYSSNGEQVWFHDVRHQLNNRSRRVAGFHAPPSAPTRGTLVATSSPAADLLLGRIWPRSPMLSQCASEPDAWGPAGGASAGRLGGKDSLK